MSAAGVTSAEAAGPGLSPGTASVSHSTVAEVDGYESSVAGVQIRAVRTGQGSGANSVLTVREGRFTSSSCRIGFPIATRTTIGDEQMVLACITSPGPGSRWCGIDLEPGAVILYGPGAEHAAVNKPGLGFTFVTMSLQRLGTDADRLRLRPELPARGEVVRLGSSARTRAVGGAFLALREAAARNGDPTRRLADEVLRSTVEALYADDAVEASSGMGGLKHRHLVAACVEYAEAVGRRPSLPELCAAANVSERTLNRAFSNEFGLPPARFFHRWALDKANRRLRAADAESGAVSQVAWELGFTHLGRFAGAYRGLFGEPPSRTLRSP